jgi:hypothetical protein
MSIIKTLTVGQSNRIALADLVDSVDGTPVTSATVTHTLRDAAGAIVAGESARVCAHDSGGTYRALLPETLAIAVGRAYRGTYVVVIGGLTSEWVVDYLAVENVA